ncbi:MAG: hypothetical protein II218_10065 [Peptococcaceae bacterium]|jgi:vacuolar-type H+-ATPase subunit H|nr:hypothetical protein [Peptococcaceae bacterium]MBQ2119504.1 hypothetical protein [Peptococcaceae bacterium]MBQ5858230.1 hypothetical protein [Peptococcaceae bacterium]
MEAEFSKKMCRRLADYEYYLKTECKSPLLQKDKIVVDRDQLLDLVADLLAFHSADQHLEESVELDVGTVQMTKEQILKNAAWQARQMVSEAEVVRASTLENALEEAKKEAERITGEAKSYDAKVKAEAEEIVNMTLSERREELEKARRELEESREGVLNEARKEGEIILEEVRKEAEELRQRLDEEIENYRKAREAELKESLKEAQKIAQETLEEKTRDALQLYADTVHKTEEMVNLIVAIYDQQLEVIQQDRKDISAIVEKLERQNLPHGLQRSRR